VRPRTLATAACYLVLSAGFASLLFAFPNATGWRDWDFHLFLHAAVLKSLVEYGQLPLWNPWYCGGNVLWANPQAAFFSPVYPLAAVMSIPLAMKINIVIHYWVGLVGMHLLLTRIFGLKFLPAILFLASAFVFSGAPALHLAVGHANFLPAFYLPFLLYFFFFALESGAVRHAAIGGGVLALIAWNGGLHVVPMAAAIVGVIGLVSSIARRDWRPALMAAIVGGFAALLAAPRIVPLLFFVTSPHFDDARSATGHPDLMTLEMLLRSLIDPWQNRGYRLEGQIYEWIEYGNYVGLPFVLASLFSLFLILRTRLLTNRWFGVALGVTTIAMLVMSAGEFSPWAPASLFERVPLLSSFRVPSRYIMAATLCAVLTVAWIARVLDLESLGPRARLVVAILCLLATGDLVYRNRAMLGGAFIQDPVDARFHLLAGPTTLAINANSSPLEWGSPMFRSLMNGQSFYRCYEVMQTARKADTTHPLIWADDDTEILETRFSPNRIEYSVTAIRRPSRVRLNQNFATGWRNVAGAVEPDPGTGQPSIVVRPGETGTFSFAFSPPGLLLGWILAVIGIGGGVYASRLGVEIRSEPQPRRHEGTKKRK
jgi:hypothetical protein